MRRMLAVSAVALMLVAGSAATRADITIDFDDLTGTTTMPEIYGGINWGDELDLYERSWSSLSRDLADDQDLHH